MHLLSTNHKCTQPCYFPCCTNLLLRRWRWTRFLRWGVLDYALPQLMFLWCYRVFRCSIFLESHLVFKDIIYVINILYSSHLIICEQFWFVCVEQLILGIHTMSTRFCLQNWVWQKWYESRVNRRNASLDRRVLYLILFWVDAIIFYSNLLPLFLIYKI
jgi:hypothetical protein